MPAAGPDWELITDLGTVRREWSALAERSGSLFATWEWADSWWRYLGRGRLATIMIRDGAGEATALVPLYRVAGSLFLLGSGSSDELGPVSCARDRRMAADSLGQWLAVAPFAWDTFVGDDMPGDLAWDELLGGRIVGRRASPVLRADGMSWQDFLSEKSANFRAQVGARERRLRRDHRVVLYQTEDPMLLERDLDTLFRLHVARWGWARAQKFAGRRHRLFVQEFAATALRRGWLRLRILELDGRSVAAMLSFRFGGSEWYYQGGRDPDFGPDNVGFVLQVHAVREALNDGIRSYRFLRGDEAYKSRFANADARVVTVRAERPVAPETGPAP